MIDDYLFKDNPSIQIALLIDADNVAAKHMAAVFGYLGSMGKIKIAKAFGRTSTLQGKKWAQVIKTYAIGIKEHQHEGNNSADFSLSIYGIELLIQYPHIGCFCVVSSDGDFIHLVSRLKQSDKKVIGIGNANASIKLREACDRYVTFAQLETPPLTPTPQTLSPEQRKHQLNANQALIAQIKAVLAEKSKNHDYVKLSAIAGILGNEPRRLKSKDYGYKSWRDLFFDLSCVDVKIEGIGQVLVRLNLSVKREAVIVTMPTLSTGSGKMTAGKMLTDMKYAFYSTRRGGINAWVDFEVMLAFLKVAPSSDLANGYLAAAQSFFEARSVNGAVQFRFKNPNRGKYRQSKANDNFGVNPNDYQASLHYRAQQRQPMTDWECCMADMGIPSDAWDWYDD